MQRYSERLSWSFFNNPHSKLINEKLRTGTALLDLTGSNPTKAGLDYPHHLIQQAFGSIQDFTYQPEPLGELHAQLAVASYYLQRGVTLAPNRICLTACSSESYGLLFKLLCNPGDEVLVPIPSYPLFEYLASLESVRILPYWLRYDGSWFIDFDDLKGRIGPRTRAVVIVNPNNPTGSFIKHAESETLMSMVRHQGLTIISDEVFMDYTISPENGRMGTLAGLDETLSFSLNGLSKACGMPQMKLGWIVINGPEAERETARARLELLLDTYLSVNTPVQRCLPSLFTIGQSIQEHIVERVRSNFAALKELLENSPAHPLYLEGGWSAIIHLSQTETEEVWVTRLLNEHDVILQPGYFFDMGSEPYAIASLLTRPEIFREGILRLRDLQRNP